MEWGSQMGIPAGTWGWEQPWDGQGALLGCVVPTEEPPHSWGRRRGGFGVSLPPPDVALWSLAGSLG